jgi:molybdopterin-synthase adenylyltransferase
MESNLSIAEFKRYYKQILLPEIGQRGQEQIKKAKVLVIGAGGLGCPILQYLSAAGVGNLGLLDFDTVDESNLHRQTLYGQADIGQSKVKLAAQELQRRNSYPNYQVFDEKLTAENAANIIGPFDIIVDGCDNFATRYLVNDTCVNLGKSLVYGSILGYEGQMAVLNHQGGKQLRDLFPEAPNPDDVPNCSLNGVMGTLPGIIGSMMAHECLKMIIGLPHLHNQLLIFNSLTWDKMLLKF